MFDKVLVTGADGFIGSHLVEQLLARGFKVKAFCLYNSLGSYGWLDSLNPDLLASVEVVLGDIRDPVSVKNAMQGCDCVLHLAALIAIPYSYVAPGSYVDTNIHGTLNVVQAAKELGVAKVVHTSTSETYGTAQYVPIDEHHPLVGQSPYAATKIGADQVAISYWRSFGTPVSILRPFNTYGPRQSARAVIPTIITQIASGQSQIKLGALSPTRDFNFVIDTCNAFIAIATSDQSTGRVVNSASNFEVSIGETFNLIAELMNADVEVIADDQRLRPEKSEVNRLFGSNELIRDLTDWSPQYGGVEGFKKGLAKTIEWFTNSSNLSHYKPDQYTV